MLEIYIYRESFWIINLVRLGSGVKNLKKQLNYLTVLNFQWLGALMTRIC